MCVTPYSSQWEVSWGGSVRISPLVNISKGPSSSGSWQENYRSETHSQGTYYPPRDSRETGTYPSKNTKAGHRSCLYRGQEEHKVERLERTPSFRATKQFKKQPVTNSSFKFEDSLYSLSTLTRWLWEHEEACSFIRRDSVLSTYPVSGSSASQPLRGDQTLSSAYR